MYPSYSPLFTLGLLAERVPAPSTPSNDDTASAFYFTLQRDSVEFRSFLYLDLADNKRHRPSHRRTLTKSTSWTCTVDATSIRTETPMTTTTPGTPVVPTRRRTSKESLRNIPSPKPAPSATLPDLPIALSSPPSSLKKRPASTVVSSPLSPTIPRLRRPASLRSESISSHDRRRSRMDALACLEGRSRAPNRIPRASTLRNNFMSFSDDEDDTSTSPKSSVSPTSRFPLVEDVGGLADVEDEMDAIMPALTRSKRAAVPDEAKPVRPAKSARKRRGTLESWFPLKSFIDLKDDDLSSWNWRSFIEIGGVA